MEHTVKKNKNNRIVMRITAAIFILIAVARFVYLVVGEGSKSIIMTLLCVGCLAYGCSLLRQTLKPQAYDITYVFLDKIMSYGIQILSALSQAHENLIIHRDIKPQNIMISKEGKVKVTDFGIAKAVTSNTITSNVMGSVHYTSPEQARGGYSDEKSDIYSLGITMFEMLTGRVPFNGETTVAIAIKHIQEPMPSPREYIPEIPISVEQIVFKCTQKSPDRRYQSMPEVVADLKQSLMHPDEDFVKMTDPDEEAATRMISEQDMQQIKKQSKKHDSMDEAILHIRKYGTKHSEVIVTNDYTNARKFQQMVDAAVVYLNASSRFSDGFQFGFGAEIGISTQKLHARGPVGLEGMVTYKYKLQGDGHIVGDYASGKRSFHFKNL